MRRVSFFISLLAVLFLGCNQNKERLFSLADDSGIEFVNTLTESKKMNVFNYRNFYNGGGVAIGDLNNDGLPEVFLTGNQVANKLFLNLGSFKFKDISSSAGIFKSGQWSTGVTFVDINHDGWLDVYVCNAGNPFDSLLRRNQLYINNHDLTFSERAAEYGLDEMGYSTHASFFDYDLDGDLDCFIIDNSPIPANTLNFANKREVRAKDWDVAPFLKWGGDHLFRNENEKFREVSEQAGIHGSLISLGLGVTVGDVNQDGYPDIFVSNDFFERDYLYINQRNGTFKDEIEQWVQHISLSSMGADMQDINNDGYPDIFTTDMLPDNDYRLKTTSSFDNFDTYHIKEQNGFYHQFMQNTLQVNNQNQKFMETSYFSGVAASDWSWGALIFDADNDGWSDIFVCNGIRYDLTDQDFINFFSSSVIQEMIITGKKEEMNMITSKMSSSPLPNKLFRNLGALKFHEKAAEWGLAQTSFSNGAAYGDLDRDGDLDLVVNNVNQNAFVYRNNSTLLGNHYLLFNLKGDSLNQFAVGSKVQLYVDKQVLLRELIPSRGFQSSMDYLVSFGIGNRQKVDSVKITWPDGMNHTIINPKIDTEHLVQKHYITFNRTYASDLVQPLFLQSQAELERHQEDDYVDFYTQRNLPRMLSKEGPHAATGDVDGNGLADMYVCGGSGQTGMLYLQKSPGKFERARQERDKSDLGREEVVSLFFDADGDMDLDLFIGHGGNNQPPQSKKLQHQLLINDGKGHFSRKENAMPENGFNISTATALDFDEDGDLDLFVGSQCVSFIYGVIPESSFLVNDGSGVFQHHPAISLGQRKLGMVTSSVAVDLVGGSKKELVVVGEWMNPKVLEVGKGGYREIKTSLQNLSGWWQTVASFDLDSNGKEDLVLGNIGKNFYLRPDSLHPAKLWVDYFGIDGSTQQFISQTVDGKNVPVFMKKPMEEQFLYLKKKNLQYVSFASKSVEELFDQQLTKDVRVFDFDFPSSVVAWNVGEGKFKVEPLPDIVQLSSVNAIGFGDFNFDGHTDVVMGGNIFDFTPQLGRLDSNFGIVLINNGDRNFSPISMRESGIQLTGQVRDVKVFSNQAQTNIVFIRNSDVPVMYQSNRATSNTRK
jgi:hypothetical protein